MRTNPDTDKWTVVKNDRSVPPFKHAIHAQYYDEKDGHTSVLICAGYDYYKLAGIVALHNQYYEHK